MANYLPVFTCPRAAEELAAGMPTRDQVIDYLMAGDRSRFWQSCSRNGWHAKVMRRVVEDYPEYAPLAYLADLNAILRNVDIPRAAAAMRRLLADIDREPHRIAPDTDWTGYGHEQVREFLRNSRPMKNVVEDEVGDIPGLFCFMRSQVEALEQAEAAGKWILYFRFE